LALRSQYNPAFDGLRALAIGLVILGHCRVPVFRQGYFGVDIFFVLSGFLITRLLVDELDATGRIVLRRFYLRRFLRLAPALLLCLSAYVLVAPWLWPQYEVISHIRDAGLVAFYLADYSQAFWHSPNVLVHMWSLSVEEHFYLIWPLAILVLARIDLRWSLYGLLALYLLGSAWRIFEYENMGWDATYYRFDTRFGGLVCGSMLSMFLQNRAPISKSAADAAGVGGWTALVVCLSIGYWGAPWSLVVITPLAHVAGLCLVISASTQSSWVNSILSAPPLVGIGVISYGMYLWHYPAAFYLRELMPWYLTAPIVLGFSVIAAAGSYLSVERPLKRYRRNLGVDHNTSAESDGRATQPALAPAAT
jgi:peptidoglycan/LPS O-acetylase OafA/YrhL